MSVVIERKLFATGDSVAVTIPKDWVRHFGLKAGDSVEITFGDELVIRAKEGEYEKSILNKDLTEKE